MSGTDQFSRRSMLAVLSNKNAKMNDKMYLLRFSLYRSTYFTKTSCINSPSSCSFRRTYGLIVQVHVKSPHHSVCYVYHGLPTDLFDSNLDEEYVHALSANGIFRHHRELERCPPRAYVPQSLTMLIINFDFAVMSAPASLWMMMPVPPKL